ncbi:MAG: hypothetical protein ACRCY4_04315, partial [Brevinema sp.]
TIASLPKDNAALKALLPDSLHKAESNQWMSFRFAKRTAGGEKTADPYALVGGSIPYITNFTTATVRDVYIAESTTDTPSKVLGLRRDQEVDPSSSSPLLAYPPFNIPTSQARSTDVKGAQNFIRLVSGQQGSIVPVDSSLIVQVTNSTISTTHTRVPFVWYFDTNKLEDNTSFVLKTIVSDTFSAIASSYNPTGVVQDSKNLINERIRGNVGDVSNRLVFAANGLQQNYLTYILDSDADGLGFTARLLHGRLNNANGTLGSSVASVFRTTWRPQWGQSDTFMTDDTGDITNAGSMIVGATNAIFHVRIGTGANAFKARVGVGTTIEKAKAASASLPYFNYAAAAAGPLSHLEFRDMFPTLGGNTFAYDGPFYILSKDATGHPTRSTTNYRMTLESDDDTLRTVRIREAGQAGSSLDVYRVQSLWVMRNITSPAGINQRFPADDPATQVLNTGDTGTPTDATRANVGGALFVLQGWGPLNGKLMRIGKFNGTTMPIAIADDVETLAFTQNVETRVLSERKTLP